jgi:hypothetical protein
MVDFNHDRHSFLSSLPNELQYYLVDAIAHTGLAGAASMLSTTRQTQSIAVESLLRELTLALRQSVTTDSPTLGNAKMGTHRPWGNTLCKTLPIDKVLAVSTSFAILHTRIAQVLVGMQVELVDLGHLQTPRTSAGYIHSVRSAGLNFIVHLMPQPIEVTSDSSASLWETSFLYDYINSSGVVTLPSPYAHLPVPYGQPHTLVFIPIRALLQFEETPFVFDDNENLEDTVHFDNFNSIVSRLEQYTVVYPGDTSNPRRSVRVLLYMLSVLGRPDTHPVDPDDSLRDQGHTAYANRLKTEEGRAMVHMDVPGDHDRAIIFQILTNMLQLIRFWPSMC